jgi:hypothetical protein
MHMFRKASFFAFAFAAIASLLAIEAAPAGAKTTTDTWFTGQRAFGQSTVEPSVDDATGQEVFLLTPNHAPFPSKAPDAAQAPLYMVAYPTNSTIADPLNCTPTTCDHVASVEVPWYPSNGLLKGHDHLVGIADTGGDYNVAWDVELDVFTQQGFADGAINTRILTLDQLNAAVDAGDVMRIDTGIVFNCSKVSPTTYMHATPLSFPLPG